MAGKHLYKFGAFCLEPERRLLTLSGSSIPIPAKAFDILHVLVHNAGSVVEKDALMKLVWPDTIVEENNLTVAISLLRKALNESPNERRFIATIPGRGYQFVAEVSIVGSGGDQRILRSPPDPSFEPSAKRTPLAQAEELHSEAKKLAAKSRVITRRQITLTLASVAVLAAVIAGFILWFHSKQPRRAVGAVQPHSVAVIPFEVVSQDTKEQDWGLGMADALIIKLSAIPQIRVRPTSAVARYNPGQQSPVDVGRTLQVDSILEGQIQKTGSRICVTVQLVSSQDNATLWADKFDQESTDIFALEDAISERVASKLLPELTDRVRKALAKSYTLSPEAQQLYLKRRYFFDSDTEEDLKKGIEYYTKATERDPNYALAYAGIANAYCELVIQGYLSPSEAFGKAKAAAVKALALDENLAEAHIALGTVAWAHDWDWAGAEREYQRAVELNANSPAVHGYYAFYFVSRGRNEEAIAEIQRAVELDPVSLSMTQELGFIYLAAHRYDEAISWFNRSLELNPRDLFARALLATSYAMKGDHSEAITECKQIPPELLGPGEQLVSAYAGFAYAVSGQPSAAEVMLKDLQQHRQGQYIDPYLVAGIYAGLGETDLAIRWLNLAYEQHSMSMVFLNAEPFFLSLHSDPRFADLTRRVGLAR